MDIEAAPVLAAGPHLGQEGAEIVDRKPFRRFSFGLFSLDRLRGSRGGHGMARLPVALQFLVLEEDRRQGSA